MDLFYSGAPLAEPKSPINIGNRSPSLQYAFDSLNVNGSLKKRRDRSRSICHCSRSRRDYTRGRRVRSRTRHGRSRSRCRRSSPRRRTSPPSRHYRSRDRYRHRSERKSTLLVQLPIKGISNNDGMAHPMMFRDQNLSPFVDIHRPSSPSEPYYPPNQNHLNADLFKNTSKYFPESNSYDSLPRPEHSMAQIEMENYSSRPLPEPRSLHSMNEDFIVKNHHQYTSYSPNIRAISPGVQPQKSLSLHELSLSSSKDCVKRRKQSKRKCSCERCRYYSPKKRISPLRFDPNRRSPVRIDHKRKSPLRSDHKRRSPLRFDHKRRSPLRIDHKREMSSLVHAPIKGRESIENDEKMELDIKQDVIKEDAKDGKNKQQDQSNLKSKRQEPPKKQHLYPLSPPCDAVNLPPRPHLPRSIHVHMWVPIPPLQRLPPPISVWRPRPPMQMPFTRWPYPHNNYRMAHPIQQYDTNLSPVEGQKHVRPPTQGPSYGWRHPHKF